MARGLAIVGMLAAHVGPTHLESLSGRVYALLVDGRASVLFMLLAGVGAALLTTSRSTSRLQGRLRLLWTALLLLPLGLALQTLEITVNVILVTYAGLFTLAALGPANAPRVQLILFLLSATLGPLIFLAGTILAPEVFNRAPLRWGDPLPELLHGLFLSGPFPVITWGAPFFLGMWLGQRDLSRIALRDRLIVLGGALAVIAPLVAGGLKRVFGTADPGSGGRVLVTAPEGIGPSAAGTLADQPPGLPWLQLLDATPHSQMPFWLWGSLGSALLVLGLSLALAEQWERTTRPLVWLGQAALSVYVGHLVALHFWREALVSQTIGEALLSLVLMLAIALPLIRLGRLYLRRGPLESLLTGPWTLASRAR